MTYKVSFVGDARAELKQVYDYYGSFGGTKHIERLYVEVQSLVDRLKIMPKSGMKVGNIRKAVLMKRYVVIYRIYKKNVRIAHIFDGRTDYDL